ncbi:uroporphyrinogen decarboxylase [Rhizosaccharibacter radicis]|uniref:Uroporphyrinogen decarboxylase n=1 Tax=Rhizosaccharibacter radicis TaxID=2782605 RepID=A0ABT1VUM6_9PROT|nr:uroporphyrinogen decarboxylase [Acetobacteraceae bacterium KSS12]
MSSTEVFAPDDDKPAKKLLRVLRGEPSWPPPMWLMRQAGRYLPEFRAMRAQADFITRCMTPETAVELTLQPIRRYAMDGAILFSDILILPWAMGQPLEFRESVGPVLEPIRDRDALRRLDPSRVAEATAPVAEALRRLRAALDGHDPAADLGAGRPGATALLGFAGAPFTVACYMVEGRGSREFAETRTAAYRDPAFFEALIELLAEQTALTLCRQIEAGAEAVMLFDSWAGLLPPGEFRRHVIGPAAAIVRAVRARHPGVPVIGFPRLGGLLVGEYAAETGVDALALDTGADLEQARRLVPDRVALQGNLDPLRLLAGGDGLVAEAQAVCRALRGRPHVFNLGHGVLPQTPPEHVGMLVDAVRSA